MDEKAALALAERVMSQEEEAIFTLRESLGRPFLECAQLLSECQGLIWVTGVGTSAAVGQRFAHILSCCGAKAMFLSPADGLHGHSGVMSPGDVLVAMSRGGESREVNEMVSIAKARGVITIAFVHNPDSSLAKACGHVLPIPSKQEYELMGYLATTSTVAFSAMCDALCAVVLETKGYTPEAFSRTHPGGAVGKMLRKAGSESG